MQDKIEEIKKQAEEKIKEIKNSQELQELKVKMLGKKNNRRKNSNCRRCNNGKHVIRKN